MKRKKNPKWDVNVLNTDIPLHNLIKNTLSDWYDSKHRHSSFDEVSFLNGIQPEECPYCDSQNIVKNGKNKDGLQRFKCKNCEGFFTIITNTIFDSHKIAISEWIEYLIHLFEFHSIKSSARDNRNAEITGKYWIIKVFRVLKDFQNNIFLTGRIYFDETYVPYIKKDIKKKKASRICVGIATNGKYTLALSENVAKESFTSTLNTFRNKIMEGSTLVHDDNHSHNILIKELKLKSEVHSVTECKSVPPNKNPLQIINDRHFLYKTFLRSHGGFDRKNINDWNNLYAFMINPPFNVYEKIAFL